MILCARMEFDTWVVVGAVRVAMRANLSSRLVVTIETAGSPVCDRGHAD
jgi:hypothetical protein